MSEAEIVRTAIVRPWETVAGGAGVLVAVGAGAVGAADGLVAADAIVAAAGLVGDDTNFSPDFAD